MQTRDEIASLVQAISTGPLRLRDEEYAELETTLRLHPEIWPTGLADTFDQLQRKLRWENADRQRIPDSLLDFFDQKFKRDLDPVGLARQIAHEISGSCAECECRC